MRPHSLIQARRENNMFRFIVQLTFFFAILLSYASHAEAHNGYVYGRLEFYQAQGNYCPSSGGADCTGAKYREADFHRYSPVRHAKVWLRNVNNGNIIGTSSTNNSGDYAIHFDTNNTLNNVDVYWRLEEADGVFRILKSTGGRYRYDTSNRNIGSGNAIQFNMGTRRWGSLSSPNLGTNIYDGATRAYHDGLDASATMRNRFTGVDIERYHTNDCPTSCLEEAAGKLIYMDGKAHLRPLARVAHEMGHMASYLASPTIRSNNGTLILGCGSTFNGNDGWSMETEEFRCTAMEEAFASVVALYAFYNDTADDPWFCNSEEDCHVANPQFAVETHPDGGCNNDMERWPGAALAYLWDVIDDNGNDTIDESFADLIDTLGAYDVGFGNHDVNEQFNSSWAYDRREGRSAWDFAWNMDHRHSGVDTEDLWDDNCLD